MVGRNNGSKTALKILGAAAALAVAFGMGILAYHELNTRVLRPTRSIIMRNEASGLTQQDEAALPGNETGEEQAAQEETKAKEAESSQAAGQSGKGQEQKASAAGGDSADEISFIGEEAAVEAALTHAGVAQGDTSYLNCHVDYDDGRAKCYDVEFRAGNTEYEYEIDLCDGSIIESSMDVDDGGHNGSGHEAAQAGGTYIGEEAAWAKALDHAGVEESMITGKKAQLDEEDGRMVYEIEFDVGRTEYEYEIDAVSGEILKWDEDREG